MKTLESPGSLSLVRRWLPFCAVFGVSCWLLTGTILATDGEWTGLEVSDRERLFHRLKFLRMKNPGDPVNTFRIGNLYQSLEMEDEAIKEYRRCLRINPEYEGAKWFLSHVLVSKGYFDEAFRLTRELLDKNPEDPRLYAWAGEILRKLDQPELAKEYFVRETELVTTQKEAPAKQLSSIKEAQK
ncbi:MAG: tetratricopeptide repeat protein [Candidatus Riflebacteria bacterium]|nr:tetratricopeptide repeat protein [Candidatus Riflebacteria bacterium]